MLTYYAKRSAGEEFEELQSPLIHGSWVHGTDLSVHELNDLVERYALDANIVYDVRDQQELSRVEIAGDDIYTFLRLPRISQPGHVVASPLLCVLKPNVFITISMSKSILPDEVARTTVPLTTDHSHDLLVGIIAAVIASYSDLMKYTERSINDTARRLKSHDVTNHDFIQFVTVEDNLTLYRMNLGGILTVINRLSSNDHSLLSEINREALEDIALHIQQLLTAVQSYSSRVESIQNAYSTIANNTLNNRMKTLTVFTVLITVPNVYYGMFGMNVALPFTNVPGAYFFIVGFTVVLTILVYIVAKWRKLF